MSWMAHQINQYGDFEVIDPLKNSNDGHYVVHSIRAEEHREPERIARLIAAAPELMEDLKALKGRVETMAQALHRKGLGSWVASWLSDEILDCHSLDKAGGLSPKKEKEVDNVKNVGE